MVCNLADLASVRKFAAELPSDVDVLCLNAGVAPSTKASAPKRTSDGFEECIGTNHIGHFLLAGLLQRNQRDAGSGLPGLSRIPGFDRIFGTKTNDGRQTELILMLTPRVVRNQAMPAGNVVSFDSGTEARVTTERVVLFTTPHSSSASHQRE